jgi:hypothetical protein
MALKFDPEDPMRDYMSVVMVASQILAARIPPQIHNMDVQTRQTMAAECVDMAELLIVEVARRQHTSEQVRQNLTGEEVEQRRELGRG